MTKRELEETIIELERRVRDLEARPVIVLPPVFVPCVADPPPNFVPAYWPNTTC